MNEFDWIGEEAERQTHELLPDLIQLAKVKGIASAFGIAEKMGKRDDDLLERRVSALIKLLVVFKPTIQETELSDLLKEFYEFIDNNDSQSPLELFYGDGLREHDRFKSSYRPTLPRDKFGRLAKLWREVPDFSQCEWLQGVYWFNCIWTVPSLPIESRLLLAVMGVRILVRGDWLLRDGCFEEELLGNARDLGGLTNNAQNNRVYKKVGGLLLSALSSDGVKQTEEFYKQQAVPVELPAGTPHRLPSDEQGMLRLLQENPHMTHKEVGVKLGISERVSQRWAQRLRTMGLLVREGATRGGRWRVVSGNESGEDG